MTAVFRPVYAVRTALFEERTPFKPFCKSNEGFLTCIMAGNIRPNR